MSSRAIVLDANILIRAVLGTRVRELILSNASTTNFFAPDVAFADAIKYLPDLLKKRGIEPTATLLVLNQLSGLVQKVDSDIYSTARAQALQRIARRDADDWPVLACALTLGCPVWTEDADFFGTGVPTWTTDRIGLYFSHT